MSNSTSPQRRPRLLASIALSFAMLALPGVVLAGQGDCSQPTSTGSIPKAADCIFILKAALGVGICELCVCDLDDSKTKTAADALRCLKKAVGQTIALNCPVCPTTTTTIAGPPESSTSTTSTSTTSTTTTIPVKCIDNGDCSALPSAFRCNPHTDTCEKPCTRTSDCKDFYECNKTTQYCESPSLLF